MIRCRPTTRRYTRNETFGVARSAQCTYLPIPENAKDTGEKKSEIIDLFGGRFLATVGITEQAAEYGVLPPGEAT